MIIVIRWFLVKEKYIKESIYKSKSSKWHDSSFICLTVACHDSSHAMTNHMKISVWMACHSHSNLMKSKMSFVCGKRHFMIGLTEVKRNGGSNWVGVDWRAMISTLVWDWSRRVAHVVYIVH